MESESLRALKAFVRKAEKLGKYRSSTAAGLRAALRMVESGLTDADPDTTDYLVGHFEEILHRRAEKADLAPNTLQTYLQRAQRVASDWKAFGQHPKALLAWKPKHVVRSRRETSESPSPTTGRLRRLAWSLRPDMVVEVQLPADFNRQDRERLGKLLDLELELLSETDLGSSDIRSNAPVKSERPPQNSDRLQAETP
jgi:hypothetical protein